MLKKKGISPLIATVLLVGLVVMIATSVYVWYGSVLRGEMQKRGAMSEIETDCATVIDLDVSDARFSESDMSIDIKNTGSEIFHGVRVIADKTEGGTVVLSEKEMFKPGVAKKLEIKCVSCTGNGKIQVMPMIVRQGIPGTCSDKKVVYNLQ